MSEPDRFAAKNRDDLDRGEADPSQSRFRTLNELVQFISGQSPQTDLPMEDMGLAETIPFPFLAIVGQAEMKLALLIALINPQVGGVLLIGPRGTGKTTAARSLVELVPPVVRSACPYGCLPEDIEAGGLDAVCPDCAQKYGHGIPLTKTDRGKLIELPLNARLEDVIGGLDERAMLHERLRLKRGILAQADLNILFADEVNLLGDEIVDSILDAAASGAYTVRRGPVSATYRARFTLIGTMNPEEGNLRPQIMDRFGLRVLVEGLTGPDERLSAYERASAYRNNPRLFTGFYTDQTLLAQEELQEARRLLKDVIIPQDVAMLGIQLIRSLGIDSLRAEMTLFESARAYTAADGRTQTQFSDIRQVASMALRLRRSQFMQDYFQQRQIENQELDQAINRIVSL
ncbi:MAG: magnesium chelatase [Chloroflexi bacterium]|nr:ATP-binding protein [Anaerolineaceae bacterium]NMB87157.1 magnesium chelatase [Chloroflexota bacterium]